MDKEVELNELPDQIKRLAHFIIQNFPGEPSQNEGAVDTAIRLMTKQQKTIDDLSFGIRNVADRLTTMYRRAGE